MPSEAPSLNYVRRKIERARRLLEDLGDGLGKFDLSAPWEVHSRKHPLTGRPVSTLTMTRPFDEEWQLLVSEFAHHLRSALDQTVAQMVMAAGGTSSAHRGGFPIALSESGYFVAKRGGKSYRERSLQGNPDDAKEVVDGHQPFRDAVPAANPLARLNVMANGEKHRVGQPLIALLRGTTLMHIGERDLSINLFKYDAPGGPEGPGPVRVTDGVNLWDFVTEEHVAFAQAALEARGYNTDLTHLAIPRMGVGFDLGDGSVILYPDLMRILRHVDTEVLPSLAPFVIGSSG